MKRLPLVVIVGPTAVGKTALSIEIAKAFHGEVINGDAFQVYKRLDIGTAKPTVNERQGVPHHLLNYIAPDESFSAAEFQRQAKKAIHGVREAGHLPILVGGTGMYVKSVTSDWQFEDQPANLAWREKMEQHANQPGGKEELHEALRQQDKAAAERIHQNNTRKVIRALELIQRGKAAPVPLSQTNPTLLYDVIIIGLEMERSKLYSRIEQRVDRMIDQGLVQEVERLYEEGYAHTQAMKAIGYKELVAYFEGEYSFEQAVDRIKIHSRQFAKRQLTWFKNKETVTWFDMGAEPKSEDFQGIVKFLEGIVQDVSK
ncbi:tRNA (adenosine(37)-N6)-dimethylallyltransferase MiaA [Geomicrobium sp. JCM 19039]|uniref:tRNA (adenosine(37)-N6)-dimethylallyltransferase MiaA n=1 Tax=Geomicrobium sp. JCM 19039 TaxID=1460636 RepID=UPI00045F490B|nr:tRNA (adenosine(37)-N6)-dimethylallyltransferase MiaA [Geomicrobium sp. JCM 19039]GAK11001.1 tRNA delta(2)-isopentenylpyrophosphate transferase [Geomicrobium sp. JCM 19039]